MNNEIRASYTHEVIRVYQAYNKIIANEAILKGTFGSNFEMDRMTWIKPSFLWMMYRCGWATKENQEHVLAIDMSREGFDYIVKNSVSSVYNADLNISHEAWKEQIKESDIRCQWDPERDIYGNPLNYRSIQLGIRGDTLRKYVNEWIISITDITGFVKDLKEKKDNGTDIKSLLPKEKKYIY